jgi:hypothetical protein
MPTEADFEDGVVTERLVTVRFRLTGDRYSFQRIGQSFTLAKPHVDRDPLRSLRPSTPFPEWELVYLARQTAERALERRVDDEEEKNKKAAASRR